MPPLVGLAIAYLVGSIPFAYLAGKLTRGIDLREHGSRNLGATNVYRVLGFWTALPVLLLDAAKGALPVLLLPPRTAAPHPGIWALAYGIAAILGHARPIFLLWKGGGKGVATACGVFLALAPLPTLFSLVVFAVMFFVTGYVSLGSLVSAVALVVALLVRQGPRSPIFALGVVVALFVFWTHRANIGRLRRGEEHRFGRKGARVRRGNDGSGSWSQPEQRG
jgi:glycerol-3-phosphate acyltransferase PlsY